MMLGSRDTEVNSTDIHGPYSQRTHILVEERE